MVTCHKHRITIDVYTDRAGLLDRRSISGGCLRINGEVVSHCHSFIKCMQSVEPMLSFYALGAGEALALRELLLDTSVSVAPLVLRGAART